MEIKKKIQNLFTKNKKSPKNRKINNKLLLKYFFLFLFFVLFAFLFLFCFFFPTGQHFSCTDPAGPTSSTLASNRSRSEIALELLKGNVEQNPGPTTRASFPHQVVHPVFPTEQPHIFSLESHEGGPPKLMNPQPDFSSFSEVYYCDGGANKCLDSAAAAIVKLNVSTRTTEAHGRYIHGHTNNMGEALALLGAVRLASTTGKSLILCDTELLLRGVIGTNAIENELLKPIVEEARKVYTEKFATITLGKIKGHEGNQPNLADYLATEIQQKRRSWREEPLSYDLPPPAPKKKREFFPTPPGTQSDDIIWDACRHWGPGTEYHCEWLVGRETVTQKGLGRVTASALRPPWLGTPGKPGVATAPPRSGPSRATGVDPPYYRGSVGEGTWLFVTRFFSFGLFLGVFAFEGGNCGAGGVAPISSRQGGGEKEGPSG